MVRHRLEFHIPSVTIKSIQISPLATATAETATVSIDLNSKSTPAVVADAVTAISLLRIRSCNQVHGSGTPVFQYLCRIRGAVSKE